MQTRDSVRTWVRSAGARAGDFPPRFLFTDAVFPARKYMRTRVILVEDIPAIQTSLTAAMIHAANVEVVAVVETAEEAIEAAATRGWDVMVVDLFLRSGTGLAVLTALRRDASRQRVLVLTNHATLQIRQQCHSLGADAVFDKSEELDRFLSSLALG